MIKHENIQNVEKFCNNADNINNNNIQGKYISRLIEEYKKDNDEEIFEIATNICQRPEFKENPKIQSRYITLLTIKGEYEEIIKIAQKFPGNRVIKTQIGKIQGDKKTKINENNENKLFYNIISENIEQKDLMEEVSQKSELEQQIYYTLIAHLNNDRVNIEKYFKGKNPYEKGTIERTVRNKLEQLINGKIIDKEKYLELLNHVEEYNKKMGTTNKMSNSEAKVQELDKE